VHTACDPAPHNHNQHNQCRTPYAVIHGLVLLMMGMMMPETCWDRSLIINIRLVASCWFLCLHPRITKYYILVLQFKNSVIKISLKIEVKRSGISNIMHHLQNPKEKNEVFNSKENSITEMKVKHKRRHRK